MIAGLVIVGIALGFVAAFTIGGFYFMDKRVKLLEEVREEKTRRHWQQKEIENQVKTQVEDVVPDVVEEKLPEAVAEHIEGEE